MSAPTTKDFAEYFRLALEAGLVCDAEIESWADTMIVDSVSPTPHWLLNLSIDGETSQRKLLESVPGEVDQTTVCNLLLARIGIGNRAEQLHPEQIVRILFRWALNREIPKPFSTGAYRLDDHFEGTKSGWYSEDQFKKDLEEFLAPFRSFESLLPQSKLEFLK